MSKIPKTRLTRQHFEYFAWCVGNILDDDMFRFQREFMANILDPLNPNFQKDRFIRRCNEVRAECYQEESQ